MTRPNTSIHSKVVNRPSDTSERLDPKVRPVLSAHEAFDLLGIDRNTGYKAIKDGTFPIRVVYVGRAIRIPTAALVRLLESEELAPTGSGEG